MSKTLKYLRAFFTIIALFFALSCDEDDSAISTVNVTSVESDNFYPGDQVTMQGSNFTAVLFVFLGNNQIPFQLDGDALTFTLPANAAIGNGLVTLVMPDGYIVTRNIEVMARPFPIITGLSTSAAPEGGEVTIRGTSLNNLQSVTIGEIEANVVSSTATELIITVPSGLQQNLVAPLTITTSGGKATARRDLPK